jgi:hypothetical protein
MVSSLFDLNALVLHLLAAVCFNVTYHAANRLSIRLSAPGGVTAASVHHFLSGESPTVSGLAPSRPAAHSRPERDSGLEAKLSRISHLLDMLFLAEIEPEGHPGDHAYQEQGC